MITAKNTKRRKAVGESTTKGYSSVKKFSVLGALIGGLIGLLCFYFIQDLPGSRWDATLYLGLFAGVSGGLVLGGVVGALNDMKMGSA